jgi:hypothetical protein
LDEARMTELWANLLAMILTAAAAEPAFRAWREAGYPTLEEL